MKLNRRSFFGRLAAACGVPFLSRPEPLPVTRGADFVLPLVRHETAFGVVEMLPQRYSMEMQTALERLRQNMEITLLSGENNPHGWDEETLARIEERRLAYEPEWLLPQTA
jgi:hypothetical protein